MRNVNRVLRNLVAVGLAAAAIGGLTACDELLAGDPFAAALDPFGMGSGYGDGGWGTDGGYWDGAGGDFYGSDLGFGGVGPIDQDVFDASVEDFSDYLRG